MPLIKKEARQTQSTLSISKNAKRSQYARDGSFSPSPGTRQKLTLNQSFTKNFPRGSVYGGGGHDTSTDNMVISIDKTCASCSGQNQHIVKLFKLACIQYQSQKVNYRGHQLTRAKMI